VGILGGNFIIFRPKVRVILNYDLFLSLKINLKFKIVFPHLGSIVKVMFTLGPEEHATLVYNLYKELDETTKLYIIEYGLLLNHEYGMCHKSM
jgi:hypothetical protein